MVTGDCVSLHFVEVHVLGDLTSLLYFFFFFSEVALLVNQCGLPLTLLNIFLIYFNSTLRWSVLLKLTMLA